MDEFQQLLKTYGLDQSANTIRIVSRNMRNDERVKTKDDCLEILDALVAELEKEMQKFKKAAIS